MKPVKKSARSGLTLLEVVVSLAIFLFSVAAINELMFFSSERAMEANLETQGAYMCQSKMAEVLIGAVPMTGTGFASFDTSSGTNSDDEVKGWEWKVECQDYSSASDVTSVTVIVKKDLPGRAAFEISLSQLVYNPSKKGSTLDSPVQEPTPSSGSGSGSGSGGGSGGGNGGM